MLIFYLIIFLFFNFSILMTELNGQQSAINGSQMIQETITIQKDVTNDQVEDLIVFKMQAESWEKPIKWVLKIYDKKDLIFQISADDSFLDSFFNDHNFVQDCTSYLECKKKYYFHDFFKNMVVRSDLSQNLYAFSKDNNSSIHYVARDEIVKRFGLSEEESKKIIEKLINRLKSGEISLLYIPISPVQTMFPKVYVTELRSFITVYEW